MHRDDMHGSEEGDTIWTYALPREWHGEYAWTTDVSAEFDDVDDPVTVTRYKWACIEVEEVTFYPRIHLCETCHGDEEIVEPQYGETVRCPTCNGDGLDPKSGTMQVTKTTKEFRNE